MSFFAMIAMIIPVMVSAVAAPGMAIMVASFSPIVIIVMPPVIMVAAGITALTVIMRHVDVVVPVFFYKIDRLIAGIVTVTVFIPSLSMTRRHIKIYRLLLHSDCGRHSQNRIRIK